MKKNYLLAVLLAVFSVISFYAQETYTTQIENSNAIRTINTNGEYFAGAFNNGATEIGTFANGSGGSYIGDPGVALFRTFTINGNDETTASRAFQLGDSFTITAFVDNSSSFFNGSNAGISFNGSTDNGSFADFETNSRLKFQINQNGNWFGNTGSTVNGFHNTGSDAIFTIKLVAPNRATVTISGANGDTTKDVLLSGTLGSSIQSFAIWNQTSGNGNNMFWKNASLTATGTIELGGSNNSYTISNALTDGFDADSNSTVKSNSLIKEGTGTVTLGTNSTYTGTTTVTAGTLVLNANVASSAFTVNSGATLQISSDATISSLVVNAGGMVTVDSGITLTISNDLTLNSNSSMVVEGSLSLTGNATFNRNLAIGSQWYLMSSPVSGETYDAAWATTNSIPTSGLNTNNIGISTYDNSSVDTDEGGSDTATGHWRYLQTDDSNSDTFNAGQGYGIIRSSSDDISFIGGGIYTSTQTIPLTLGVNNFNLVGNPFTAPLNLGDFFVDNGAGVIAGAQTWFWNASTSSYDVKTSGSHGAFEIASGQGFFVDAAAATNLTFDITDVSHTTATFQKTNPRPEITLNLKEGSNTRKAYVHYINGTTTDYDLGYDGNLFGGINHSLAVYSHLVNNDQGKKYQLQSLPDADYENMVVPVGIIADAGEITFSAEAMNLPSGLKVFLEDRENNTFTRLDEANSNYKVTLTENTNGIGRFYLHTKSSALSTNDVALDNVSVYTTNSSTLRIVGLSQGTTAIKMFNILGKQVLNSSFISNGVHDVDLPNLNTGVYIVQLENENGTLNKKIILE